MSANDTQVGGSHYKTKIEHWDWVIANDLNYLEGQITKYVARARKKNGIEDLKKARHFLDKYIENWAHYDSAPSPKPHGTVVGDIMSDDWQIEGFNGDHTQHYKCRHCGASVFRAVDPQDALRQHGACARGHGYVAQG